MFKIGNHQIDNRVLLAPMAGVTDLPFRRQAAKHGAGLTTSEMVTSDTSLWRSAKSRTRLEVDKTSKLPISVQIAGSDANVMADAARAVADLGADIIDINMGCPAKKVCKKLAGSALLNDEKKVARILDAVVKSVDVPVTLKTRIGWSKAKANGVEVAKIAEACGVQAIAIHGRTRECRFDGSASYEIIREIVDTVNIPIIANGDITSPEKAKHVLDYSGASAVMIGRSAFGNPWIFGRTQYFLETGEVLPLPSTSNLFQTMLEHLNDLHSFYGNVQGTKIARKHLRWYLTNISGTELFCDELVRMDTPTEQLKALTALRNHQLEQLH